MIFLIARLGLYLIAQNYPPTAHPRIAGCRWVAVILGVVVFVVKPYLCPATLLRAGFFPHTIFCKISHSNPGALLPFGTKWVAARAWGGGFVSVMRPNEKNNDKWPKSAARALEQCQGQLLMLKLSLRNSTLDEYQLLLLADVVERIEAKVEKAYCRANEWEHRAKTV